MSEAARHAARGRPRRIAGLYAITPEDRDADALIAAVREALAGGASMVQYRAKRTPPSERAALLARLLPLTREARVPLIVNDDVALALAAGAEGAHLGQGDGDIAEARARLGPERLLGVSCHNRLDLALDAERRGADYVAFGSMFDSPTKPAAVRASPALLAEARARLDIPIVAIGGITLENAASVLAAGADALAVISALFDAGDVRVAAMAFSTLLDSTSR